LPIREMPGSQFSGSSSFVGAYCIRDHAKKWPAIKKVPHLKSRTQIEQLICALLREDRNEALDVVPRIAQQTRVADEIVAQFVGSQLFGLLYDRVHSLGLSNHFSTIQTETGVSLLTKLRELQALEVVYQEKLNNCLQELADILSGTADVQILKGPALARALYPEPHYRHSIDIDLLLKIDEMLPAHKRLVESGFQTVIADPGFCVQYGIGPTNKIEDLLLSPHPRLLPSASLAFKKPGWPYVELRVDPFESGLLSPDSAGLFDRAVSIKWNDSSLTMPAPPDHLLIELAHFAKHGFSGWHWLWDIHLLARSLSTCDWSEFVALSRRNELCLTTWAGLEMASSYLGTEIPQAVTSQLCPGRHSWTGRLFAFTVPPILLWNLHSIIEHALGAAFAENAQTRRRILAEIIKPPDEFILSYYFAGKDPGLIGRVFGLLLHWLVIIAPGGLIRRTFGRLIWRS